MSEREYAVESLKRIKEKSLEAIPAFRNKPDRNLTRIISFVHSILDVVQCYPSHLSDLEKSELADYVKEVRDIFESVTDHTYYSNNEVTLLGSFEALKRHLKDYLGEVC